MTFKRNSHCEHFYGFENFNSYILTQERKIRCTVAYKFDKWFSHCLSKGRMWCKDVGKGEKWKHNACKDERAY